MSGNSLKASFLVFILSTAVVACNSPERLTASEYKLWIESPDNELLQEKNIGAYSIEVQYKPLEYIMLLENIADSSKHLRLRELDGMVYFNITLNDSNHQKKDILKGSVSSMAEYQQAIYYYSFRFRNELKLLAGSDTIDCGLFHFVRDHGLSPQLQFVVGFECNSEQTFNQLLILENTFNTGIVKFNYDKKVLNQVPTIINSYSS